MDTPITQKETIHGQSDQLAALVAPYAPALRLDAVVPAYIRKIIKYSVGGIAALATGYLLYDTGPLSRALFLITFIVWTLLSVLEFFYNAYSLRPEATISFPLATVLASCAIDARLTHFSNTHWALALFSTRYGKWIAGRAGINTEALAKITAVLAADTSFVEESAAFPDAFIARARNAHPDVPVDGGISGSKDAAHCGIDTLISTLIAHDEHFAAACRNARIDPADIVGAARWLEWGEAADTYKERWWLRRNMAHVPGIAKRWTYGTGTFLARWGRDLTEAARWHFAPGAGYSYNFGITKGETGGVAHADGQGTNGPAPILAAKPLSVRFHRPGILFRLFGIGRPYGYGYSNAKEQTADTKRQFLVSEEAIDALESTLARFTGANALVVGDREHGASDILPVLAMRLSDATTYPELQHLRLIVLDIGFIVADRRTKADFEDVMQRIINEAALAGNIILAFDDLPYAIESAATIGVNLPVILSRALTADAVRVLALSGRRQYHDIIEQQSEMASHFEVISYDEPKGDTLLYQLCMKAEHMESRLGLVFSYGAIAAAARAAERYFMEQSTYDKAADLLVDAANAAHHEKRHMVRASDILHIVQDKTAIPVTGIEEMTGEDKEKLVHLEAALEKRVIGQRPALKAVADALRRARSGINNPDRPMGSFLFLGPTGVGKTETAKALAAQFFGGEDTIIRFDMTEYQGEQALYRLIGEKNALGGASAGAAAGGAAVGGAMPLSMTSSVTRTGSLVSALRDHKYGVLLLDEFEKTSPAVKDLFLQILDEGMFTDINGEKVSARNTIIIATSNAGSEKIWEAVGAGRDIAAEKDSIIDSIVQTGAFRPELINRFDGSILFHPLSPEELAAVARLMLEKLNKRLAAQNVKVKITDALVDYLVKEGSDRRFGGRAMNRAIQETVEARIAAELLAGGYTSGQEIEIDPQSLGHEASPVSTETMAA